jgi:hypothetical protein
LKFGEATGLYNNMQKSNAFPIRCKPEELVRMEETLPCARAEFPSTYLGLPISNKKFSKSDLLPWIEKLGDKLPGWKASHELGWEGDMGTFCFNGYTNLCDDCG